MYVPGVYRGTNVQSWVAFLICFICHRYIASNLCSHSELKRRLKAEKKAKEKLEKEQNEVTKPNAQSVTKTILQEEEISANVMNKFRNLNDRYPWDYYKLIPIFAGV